MIHVFGVLGRNQFVAAPDEIFHAPTLQFDGLTGKQVMEFDGVRPTLPVRNGLQ
jgi:hypothetical protein